MATRTRATLSRLTRRSTQAARRSTQGARAAPGSATPPSVTSSESGRTYHLVRLVGKGGFGEVHLATPEPRGGLPAQVCVKITERLTPWLREAYFAELLGRSPRALRIHDRFVVTDGGRTRYCLSMEYAEHGDLGAWLTGRSEERRVGKECRS